MARGEGNDSTGWPLRECRWPVAQMLVWIIQSREVSLREAERIIYSPELKSAIARAWVALKIEMWKAILEEPEDAYFDKFCILWGHRYENLRTVFQVPPAEPGAQAAMKYAFERDIMPRAVGNPNWIKRIFPAPTPAADASTSATNIEVPAAESEAAVASQTKHPGGAPAPAPAGDTPAAKPEAAETPVPGANTEVPVAEHKVAEASREKHPGGKAPDWDWKSMIALLQQRKTGEGPFKGKTTTFKNGAMFKQFIQERVQRTDGSDRGDGPNSRTIDRAITRHKLKQYATFEE